MCPWGMYVRRGAAPPPKHGFSQWFRLFLWDRIVRRAGTRVTAYLPGGQELTLDTVSGTLSGLRYYSFAGQTVAVRAGAGFAPVTTLIPDSQGTALASIANATDVSTRRYADPFGAPRGATPTSWAGDHRFLDEATAAVVGLTQVGARYLDTAVCSVAWMHRQTALTPVFDARHHLVVREFSWVTIRGYIEARVAACVGDTWNDVAQRLSRFAYWEFEDYV